MKKLIMSTMLLTNISFGQRNVDLIDKIKNLDKASLEDIKELNKDLEKRIKKVDNELIYENCLRHIPDVPQRLLCKGVLDGFQ